MLSINKSSDTIVFLSFCYGMQGQRRLAGSFRSENFHNPTAGQTADTQGFVK